MIGSVRCISTKRRRLKMMTRHRYKKRLKKMRKLTAKNVR